MDEKEIFGTVTEIIDLIDWLRESNDLLLGRIVSSRTEALRERNQTYLESLNEKEQVMMALNESLDSYEEKIRFLYTQQGIEEDTEEFINSIANEKEKERVRERFGRLKKNILTPVSAYHMPILSFLVKQEGESRRQEILHYLESEIQLNDADLSQSKSNNNLLNNETRWKVAVSCALGGFCSQGLVENSRFGYWKITDKGRERLTA